MHNTLTIAGRQFRSYFNGPVAYIVLALVMFFLGFWFWETLFLFGRTTAREMFVSSNGLPSLSSILTFAVPALTMGLLAEEKRSGTIELLVTMPVRDWEVVLGKFFAVLGLLVVLLLLTLPYPITISRFGTLDWGPVFTGYLGIFLEGAALMAIGLMASSWTDNQLVALFIAIGFSLALFVIDRALVLLPLRAASVLEWLSFEYHVNSMARGVLDLRDIFFFLSITGISLLLAFRALESRRWR